MRTYLLLLAIAALCACSRAPRITDSFAIQPVASPASADGSSAPQLTVTGDRALLSWVEIVDSRATLKFAERTATGWSAPRAAAAGDDWFLTWSDVPSVMRLSDGMLAAEWLLTTDETAEAYDLRLAFSKDDGRTWSAPISPHHDGTKTQHGFASMFEAPAGGLGLVWLDGRAQALTKGNDNMSVRAAVFDRAGAQLSETLVDERVCDCCPTAVALTSDGVVAAFRDRSDTEIRDVAVSRLVNGRWTAAKAVHDDNWRITACPINGPAISARGRQVAIAWMTGQEDEGHAFAAFSTDAGATFGRPIRLDDNGSLGRVGIVFLEDGSAIASWVEFANRRAELRMRRIEQSGRRGPSQTLGGRGEDRPTGIPRVVRRGRELLFAWTEARGGHSTIRTAVATPSQ